MENGRHWIPIGSLRSSSPGYTTTVWLKTQWLPMTGRYREFIKGSPYTESLLKEVPIKHEP